MRYSIYRTPVTLEEFKELTKKEDFVIEVSACCDIHDDPDSFAYKIEKPEVLKIFMYLIDYYQEQNQPQKAGSLLNIFNETIKLEYIDKGFEFNELKNHNKLKHDGVYKIDDTNLTSEMKRFIYELASLTKKKVSLSYELKNDAEELKLENDVEELSKL